MTREEAQALVTEQQKVLLKSYGDQGLAAPHISPELKAFAVRCVLAAMKKLQPETAK